MFLGIEDFDFAQISPRFCPNLIEFLINFNNKILAIGDAAASSAPPALYKMLHNKIN